MWKSFGDTRKEEDKKKKEQEANKKTVDSYIGGAESGLCVENPDKPENDHEGYSKTSNKLNLFVYKNGFKINDGPFRTLEDPANQKFIAEVKKGYIPQELVDQGLTDLGITLQESQEDYVPPKEEKKFNAFAGQGVSLDSTNSRGLEINKNVTFQVDANQPKTTISFRLHNGESVQQEFNLTHTVKDVKNFVTKVAPVQGEFNLVEGFPPKPLLDMGKTVQEAKLQNCMITQRLV